MNPFLFKLFQFFGVFPFKLKDNKIVFSKYVYAWTVFITSFFLSISIKRFLFNRDNIITIYGYILGMLTYYQPIFPLIEISLSMIPVYFSLESLERYIQNLVAITQTWNGTNKKMMTVLILVVIQCYVLIRDINVVYIPVVDLDNKIEGICGGAQTIFRTVHLLHFYVALNGMVESLKRTEVNLKNGELKNVFDEYCNVLETYQEFGELYQFFMRYCILEVFYDCMTGLKKLSDYFFNHNGVIGISDDIEALIVFWWLFLVPLLMLVLHEGHVLHDKVKVAQNLII